MSRAGSRLVTYSASVSTRFESGLNPARTNSRKSNSASLALSSPIRTRSGCVILFFDARRLIKQQPIHAQVLHGRGKPFEVHRLDDVTVDSQLVAFDYVLLLLGRGQH